MKTLLDFKNIHRGERAFIVCNGPSLNDVDVNRLQNEIVFGLNRGYLKTNLSITYLTVIARPVMKQWGNEIIGVPCKALFCNRLDAPHVVRMPFGGSGKIFQTDLTKSMFRGNTVTYVAMQLAYWMGFHEVYCIGLDHSFSYDNTEATGEKRMLVNKGNDLNHFDPNYFGDGSEWLPYEPKPVERSFAMASKAFWGSGRYLYNASTFTNLSNKIIPTIDYKDLFNNE